MRKRAWAEGGAEGKGEAGFLLGKEPDMELNLRTLGL